MTSPIDKASMAGLPSEMLQSIAQFLSIQDMALFVKLCKATNEAATNLLYSYIEAGSSPQLRLLGRTFDSNRSLAEQPKQMRLAGFDSHPKDGGVSSSVSLERLFEKRFPRLKKLTIEADDGSLSEESVNGILAQPSLEEFNYHEEPSNGEGYNKPYHVYRVCGHSNLRRISFKGIGIGMRPGTIEHALRSRARHQRPLALRLWFCDPEGDRLGSLVKNITYLDSFSFYHRPLFLEDPSFEEKPKTIGPYIQALRHAESTLTALTLDYDQLWEQELQAPDVDLRDFTKLKYLRISPEFLGVDSPNDLLQRLRNTMPPNLEHLALESFDLEWSSDLDVFDAILRNKAETLPCLCRITLHCNQKSIPDNMVQAAKEAGVLINLSKRLESQDWLDEDW